LGSFLQNSYVEVHGSSGLSVGATQRLFEQVHNTSVELAKDKVNKTEMEIRGRR
ncbi:unnamed protein product, partial [Schistosoma haematobium]